VGMVGRCDACDQPAGAPHLPDRGGRSDGFAAMLRCELREMDGLLAAEFLAQSSMRVKFDVLRGQGNVGLR
jgi:hypothetical protein